MVLLLLLGQRDAATAGHCRTLSLLLPAQQDAAAAAASVIGRYNYCVTGRCNCQRWWMLQLAAIGKCWRNRTLQLAPIATVATGSTAGGRCRSLQLLLLTLQDCNYLMLLDAATTAAGATERLQLIMLLDHIT